MQIKERLSQNMCVIDAMSFGIVFEYEGDYWMKANLPSPIENMDRVWCINIATGVGRLLPKNLIVNQFPKACVSLT